MVAVKKKNAIINTDTSPETETPQIAARRFAGLWEYRPKRRFPRSETVKPENTIMENIRIMLAS